MAEVRTLGTKRGLYISTACVWVAILSASLVSRLGTLLMTSDPLRPAQAIVVFGGHLPFRAVEAASLYHAGWAPEVWLTCGALHVEDEALARMGIDRTPEHIYSREVLQHLGVAAKGIRILLERVNNTVEEVQAVARQLGGGGGKRGFLLNPE